MDPPLQAAEALDGSGAAARRRGGGLKAPGLCDPPR